MYAFFVAILVILVIILFAPLRVKITFKEMKMEVVASIFNLPVFKLIKKKDAEKKKPAEEKTAELTENTESLFVKLNRFKDVFGNTVRLLRRFVGISDISLNLSIGTGDAALTAISTGALWAAIYRVIGVLGNICYIDNHNVEITPNFTESQFSLNAQCIIKSRIAYIIFIAITILAKTKPRKGKEE